VIDAAGEVGSIEAALRRRGTTERAEGAKAYLKSQLDFLGVDAKGVRETAREVLGRHPALDHDEVIALVRALWTTRVFDLHAVGVALLERRAKLLGADDLALLDELLRRSGTWALVDWIATKVAAPIVARDPATHTVLERWSCDPDFWLRRASMLSLLPELRAGRGDFQLFARFAAGMLDEREFFIRKAIGWVLRDTSRKRPELVHDFLDRHLDRLSGLTFREAVKHLPAEWREELTRKRSNVER
jgi:3-methyladenine DNA glycosylase AlkD